MERTRTWVECVEPALPDNIYLLSPGDIHLGAENRAKALLEILTFCNYEILVLNGDFLDTDFFGSLVRRLTKQELNVIKVIEIKRQSGTLVIYVRGNHDKNISRLLQRVELLLRSRKKHNIKKQAVLDHLDSIKNWSLCDIYIHRYKGMRYVHVHGDEWDHVVYGEGFRGFVTNIWSYLWEVLKRFDGEKHKIAHFVKDKFQSLAMVGKKVAFGAVNLAKSHDSDYIFVGHTHEPQDTELDGVRYINAGSFDMYNSSLISVTKDGVVTLHHVCSLNNHIKNPRVKKNKKQKTVL